MNKIYKVIWSKAKHCYVVTSELAKRNTKGCGARGLRMAAATLGVAAALIGGVTVPSAWAEGTTITVTGANDPIGTADPADSMGRTGSYYHPVSGSVTEVVITGGVDKSSYYFTGGYSSSEDVTGHTVQVSGAETSVRCLYGGYSDSGTARGNKILDTEAKFQNAYGGCGAAAIGNAVEVTGANIGYWDRNYSAVCGGRSRNGSASANTVKLSNSTVYYVYGGFSSNGAAGGEEKKNGNIVTLENNSRVYNKVYGGYVSYIISDNIENAIASNNTVTIDGSTAGDVYGGSINYFYSGVANANTVFIKNASEVTSVIGGDSSEANNNRVEITGSVVVKAVIGGEGGKSSNDNEVYISGIMEGKEYTVGDDVYGGGASQQSNGNTVTVTNGGVVKGYIYGARSSSGSEVKDNKVFIEKGAVAEKGIIGGYGYYTNGNVTSGNEVLIEDSTVTDASFDGWSSRGGIIGGFSSSYSATDNHVTIKNSAIGGDSPLVAGGRSFSPLTGDCIKDNTATVTNVNSEKLSVYGGLGYDGWRYNSDFKVNLENNVATVDSSIVGLVSGGYTTGTGYSKGNTAIIKNSTVRTDVYGGYSWNGECTGNTVVLDGATVGGSVLGGGNGYPDMVTGNTLMLSGTNTVDGYVGNFETIKLADTLTWSDGAVVLKMGEIYNNYNGTRPSLDIRDAETNLGTASGGQMTLLSCDETNSYKNLSLIYSGSAEPVALDESNQSQVVKAGVETPESSPVNGVTLTYASSHLVSLDADNSYKNILYKVESLPSKITLGDMTWGTGRDLAGAFTFGSGAVVDATNLTFGDITTALSVNDSMVLAENATGITSAITPTEGNNKTVKIKDYTDSATGIGYEATAKGNVKTATDAVKYTVSSVTADKITLASRAWGAAADTLPDTWRASASTEIDAMGFAYTGTATTGLKANDTAVILNATGLTTASSVTGGTGKALAVDYTDGNGIQFAAEATGHVAAAADTVNYVVDSVAVNSVDLSNWNGTGTSAVTNGWTGSGVAVATGSFAAPTDLAAGSARDIVTASTGFFTDDAITGANKYGNGETFTETEQAGVTLAGHKVGGVKADADGAKLTYYAMNKTGDTLTLGEAKFVANGTVAKYGSEYDLTAAAINADGLKFTEGQDAMKAGAVMTVVDATGAVKSGGASLVEFAGKTYEVDFTDAIDDTILTLTGKHTDTLTQDEGKTKLTYTVGDKNVDTAAFAGSVGWNQGSTYYTNTKYTFSDATKIDASGLSVTGSVTTALIAGDAMTLLSAEGITADNRVTQPTASDGIAVAYKNQGVAFNAVASGEVKAETGAVKYEVIGVALNTTDLAEWNGSAAASVPTGWTLASGATIETDGMTAPDVAAGNHVDIVKSDTDGFFASATINGANKYKAVSFNEKDGGITFKGSQSKGVTLNEEKNHIIYAAGTKDVATATVTGTIAWDTGKAYYENTKYTFSDTSKTDISGVKFTSDTDPMNQSMTLITNAAGTVTDGSPEFTVALSNTTLSATAEGSAAIDGGSLKYTVTGVTLDKVTVNEVGNDAVPEGWSVASDVAVDTDSMTVPTDVAAGEEKTILTASGTNTFSEENISGSNAYKESEFKESSEKTSGSSKGVTITGAQGKGVTVGDEGKSLVYKVGKKEVSAIDAGAVEWQKGATLLDGSDAAYDYSKIAALGTEGFDVAYGDGEPETVAAGDSMTLLKANETLKDMAEQAKAKDYSFTPVEGVTVNATLTGNLAAKGGVVTYTAAENRASKLTFGDVEWKNSGALMTRPSNIIFAGADVDTSKINFYKEMYLEADRTMTLVSDFGDSVGTLTGSKYLVGTAFEGEGMASLSGNDLIFTTKTEAGVSEQTHKAVMAAEANMALLVTGNEYVGKVLEGISDIANMGKDGISTMAAIGGGASRYETGSHVNTRTWNAAVAVGRKNETKKGTVEYGIFGEYGKGNYTLHSDVGRSDGDAHYAGGGLMAKFTNKHDVYTEASFRLGRMSDSADDLLRDGAGNAYGYDIHANYYGAHIGVGKVFKYDKGKSLDVYGKYFYTKRDGAEFDALQHYNLDSVKSSILRIGARYGTTNKLWNWYGGLAYEYEFDGEAEGTIRSGGGAITAIRAASVKGSSVRGELGLRMEASKTNPWQTDINLYGYGGKHRGFGGNVSVAYMF